MSYNRAIALGKREPVSYENVHGNTREWFFAGLEDLRLVDAQELGHGVEVYGFIQKGSASGRVVPEDELIEFRGRDMKE